MITKYPPEVQAVLSKWTACAYTDDGEPVTCVVNHDIRILLSEIDRLNTEIVRLLAVNGELRFALMPEKTG